MKFEARAVDLAAAATAAGRIIDAKTKIPILHNLLVTVAEGAVQVLGHDLDLCLAATTPAVVAEVGSVAVPGERFTKLLAGLDGDVKIETVDAALVIKSGRSRYKLPTLPAGDFPVPIAAAGEAFELDAEAARRLFVVPQSAISTEETRYYLNGISLQVMGNRLAAVATDGHRLIRSMVALPLDADALTSVIIPRAAVVEIGKLAKTEPIKVTVGPKHVEIASASCRLGSKLIDGTFPDYVRVIPARSDCSAVVDREDLIAALERIEVVAERAKNVAAVAGLAWDDGDLSLCLAHQPDTAEDLIAATTNGNGRVAASARYLIDLLGALDGETVKIECANGSSPIIITGDDDTLLLCMPCTWGRHGWREHHSNKSGDDNDNIRA